MKGAQKGDKKCLLTKFVKNGKKCYRRGKKFAKENCSKLHRISENHEKEYKNTVYTLE